MSKRHRKSKRASAPNGGMRAKSHDPGKVIIRRKNVAVGGILLIIAATTSFFISRNWAFNKIHAVVPADRNGMDVDVLKIIDQQIERVQQDPSSAERHGELGLAYEVNELADLGIQCFLNAETLAPTDPVWPYHRSICLQLLSRSDEADQLLGQVVARFPSFAPAQHRLGESALYRGEIETAERCFEKTIELIPTFAGGFVGLADVQVRRKQFAQAKATAEKALSIDPKAEGAHYVLGLSLRGLGDLERAKREMTIGSGTGRKFIADRLTNTMKRFEVNVKSIVENANILRRAGKYREATAILEESLQRRPNEYMILNNLAAVYVDLADYTKARELLLKATRIEPDNFGAYINLATCHLRLNELNEAETAALRAVEIAPNVSTTHVVKADVLTLGKRYDDALDCLRTASRLDANDPEILFKQGDIYLKLRRFEDARHAFEYCVRLAPLHLGAHVNRAATALMVGQITEAKESLAAAERIEPQNPRVKLLRDQIARADSGE